jgi:beta-ureidopropionase
MAPLEVDGAHQPTSGAGANTKAGSLAGFDSLEQLLKEHVPVDKLEEALRVLHGTKGGRPVSDLTIPKEALSLAEKLAFDLQAYRFSAAVEQLRSPRVVRVGIVQNAIVLETTAPYAEQRQAIFNRVKGVIEAAGAAGVRILCLQV